MNIRIATFLLSALLPVGCGQVSQIEETLKTAQEMSAEDAASAQIYLDDMVDSAADEETVDGTEVDESVEEDTKADRLSKMSAKLLAELDADASGSLSLEEFLAGPKKRAEEVEIDQEKHAKIIEKMTAEFNEFAGDDKLLNQTELSALLKAAAPRIGHHRHKKGGQQSERVEKSAADIIKEYDKDGDGKLSVEELQALQDARKAEFSGRPKGGKGHGPEGRGPGRGELPEDGEEGEDAPADEAPASTDG